MSKLTTPTVATFAKKNCSANCRIFAQRADLRPSHTAQIRMTCATSGLGIARRQKTAYAAPLLERRPYVRAISADYKDVQGLRRGTVHRHLASPRAFLMAPTLRSRIFRALSGLKQSCENSVSGNFAFAFTAKLRKSKLPEMNCRAPFSPISRNRSPKRSGTQDSL